MSRLRDEPLSADDARAVGHLIEWHAIFDGPGSVVQDVRRVHEHPLVPDDVPIGGYVDDVRTGRLNAVAGAVAGEVAR